MNVGSGLLEVYLYRRFSPRQTPFLVMSLETRSTLRRAILVHLAVGCWKETLDKASRVIYVNLVRNYVNLVEETDYRLKKGEI